MTARGESARSLGMSGFGLSWGARDFEDGVFAGSRRGCWKRWRVENDWERVVAPDDFSVGEGQRLGAEPLEDFFSRTPRFAVALSGGADSAYLTAAAVEAGCAVKAYLVSTAFQTRLEIDDARRMANVFDVPLEVIDVDVLAHDDLCANPPDRCRLCKRLIFAEIKRAAACEGLDVVADGTNASDDPARRPGFVALAEAGVVSPLRRAGLSKAVIREKARSLGVPTADKPRFSCLAVYVPAGVALSEASLGEAARACGERV